MCALIVENIKVYIYKMNNDFSRIIADELSLDKKNVQNTIRLLDEGCTVPFISRYRKEMTGGLDEVCIFKVPFSFRFEFTSRLHPLDQNGIQKRVRMQGYYTPQTCHEEY